MVVGQDLRCAAGQVRNLDADNRVQNRVRVGATAFSTAATQALKPIIVASIGSLVTRLSLPVNVCQPSMKAVFSGKFCGLKIIPRRQMADQIGGIETRQLLLAHGKGHDRDVIRADARRREFLVKTHIRIAIDGGHDADLLAVLPQRHHIGHDLRPESGMPEQGVVDEDIVRGHALALQIGLQNGVGGARIDVIGAQKRPFLDAQFVRHVIRGIACWFGAAPV